jgi:hypothetical protein
MRGLAAGFETMDLSGVRGVFHREQPGGVHEIDYTRWSLALVTGLINAGGRPARADAVLREYYRELRLNADLLAQQHQRELYLAAQKLEEMKQATIRRLQALQAQRHAATVRQRTDRLLNELLPLAQQAARDLRSSPGGAQILLGGPVNAAPPVTTEQTAVVDDMMDLDPGAEQQQAAPPPVQQTAPAVMPVPWLRDAEPPRPSRDDGTYLYFDDEGWQIIRVALSDGRYESFVQELNAWYPTDAFYLWCNLFQQVPAGPSPNFTCGGRPITVDWDHVTQHTFQHMTDFDVKEVHTLWPPEVGERALAGYLQQALDSWATDPRASFAVPGVGRTTLAWYPDAIGTHLRTFFPWESGYRYSVEQMSDLVDLIRTWG